MDEEQVEIPKFVLYVSESKRIEDLLQPYVTKTLEIIPCNKYEWDLLHLQLFLNSLDDFVANDKPRVHKNQDGHVFTMKFVQKEDNDNFIRIHYQISNMKINVLASTHWLQSKWIYQKHNALANIGTKGRQTSQKLYRQFGVYYRMIDIESDSAFAIFSKKHPVFYDFDSFSISYQRFVCCFCRLVKFDDDDKNLWFIKEFYETWFKRQDTDKRKTEEKFFVENEGFIEFNISEKKKSDIQKTILKDGTEYSILSGIYISPFAQSICSESNSELVHGLLMDTTWKTLPCYVTSILMASIANVGIPLGFAFGPSEDKALYKSFFTSFQEQIGVDLTAYTIESDRGSALQAIAAMIESEHLSCHHHFLRSLKGNEFSYQVGQLVACKCIKDFDILKNEYSNEFEKYIGTEKIDIINRALLSGGLFFDVNKKEIIINDDVLWEHVSQIHRSKYKMPSTTNSLESSHGHLNSKIPRRNDFYSALSRLIDFTVAKTHNFRNAYLTNYNRACRKITQRYTGIFKVIVEKEIKQYNTSIESCECGETTLLSSMLLIDLPCSHRMMLGARFPDIPEKINLTLFNNFKNLVVNYKTVDRAPDDKNADINSIVKSMAAKNVRKFSKFKKFAVIEKSIDPIDIANETAFANGMPLCFYKNISQGIHKFHDFKKAKSESSCDESSCDEQRK